MSGGEAAIRAHELSKSYRRTAAGFRLRTLKSAFLGGDLLAGLEPEQTIQALCAVSFEVARGEAFGVVGGNGSGKSTLLKLLAGMVRPTSGQVEVAGRVAALIELGAGFHPEISGRENVFINGAVLGLSRDQVRRRFDSIVEFSGLGAFIDEPVKNYSSGMWVRLGFAVAIHTDPDILLVDEVLAVGDESFAHRCLGRIEEHLASGGTLLFVSHSLTLVEEICDRVLWLEGGVAQEQGEPRRVIDAYRESVAAAEGRRHQEEKEQQATASEDEEAPRRWGSGQATIERARLLVGEAEEERYDLLSGSAAIFEIEAKSQEPLIDIVFGVAIATPRGIECWGTNTHLAGLRPKRLDGRVRVRLGCPSLRLGPGEYVVDVAAHARDGAPYDYWKGCFRFAVRARESGVGVYFPEHEWQLVGDVDWTERSEVTRPSSTRTALEGQSEVNEPATGSLDGDDAQ